ncbi:MAG: hypothetical protein EOS20_03880 [Mesorhizobium sp.]|uniref:hypothetical protein n=1 Tax=Mesorhizobium sp. TaxID=1871066 RepID=UPI000FE92BB1|nr:hypothetical protein [Mesorhizobium sp.]RWQ40187.1 MAG: hypothetical protein EOS20_03880 [Mesorhizobium sp.]
MVSLTVLPISDPDSFPGDKDFQELSRGEAIEWIVKWFFHNFEDPVHNTPYDGREGGYQYLWGGPYETYDEVDSRFSRLVADDVAEAAIEEIEEREGPVWTVSARRVVPEAEEDDTYHGDLTNDSPDWLLEQQAREQVARDADALVTALDELPEPTAGIGHNKPPEPIDLPLADNDLSELRSAASAVRQETLSVSVDGQSLSANADIILKWIRKVASWAASKLDIFVDNAVKSAGTAAGIAGLGYIITQYLSPQHATVFEAASKLAVSIAQWMSVILPGI